MKKFIVDVIENNPFESGIIFFTIGTLLMIYKLYKKEKITFNNSNIFSWKEHVFTWAIIAMSFSYSLISILRWYNE